METTLMRSVWTQPWSQSARARLETSSTDISCRPGHGPLVYLQLMFRVRSLRKSVVFRRVLIQAGA